MTDTENSETNWRERIDHWVSVLEQNAVAFGTGQAQDDSHIREAIALAKLQIANLYGKKALEAAEASKALVDAREDLTRALRDLAPRVYLEKRHFEDLALTMVLPREFVMAAMGLAPDAEKQAVRMMVQLGCQRHVDALLDLLRTKRAETITRLATGEFRSSRARKSDAPDPAS